jgi:hypothetical protein
VEGVDEEGKRPERFRRALNPVSIDKIVIQGAEFTRVADRYLLQSEVEQAFSRRSPERVPHLDRLTRLLEDIVTTADAVALEVVESGFAPGSPAGAARLGESPRTILRQVRNVLHEQIVVIDNFMQRLDG